MVYEGDEAGLSSGLVGAVKGIVVDIEFIMVMGSTVVDIAIDGVVSTSKVTRFDDEGVEDCVLAVELVSGGKETVAPVMRDGDCTTPVVVAMERVEVQTR